MAGLIAWAADVVGGGGQSNDEDDANSIPIVFSPDQLNYVRELDGKAASLRRTIQDLRLRIPHLISPNAFHTSMPTPSLPMPILPCS
ncbi:hypothetical protein CK203_023633 [Vitis vinifera]|uniref:Uncharacterized protein n=1 Tax=Vitis vinifera TaxID=29760 RepID=A0A438JBY9_VITVI|nr:hypothetical protein CK203_023633 [Vitis vinifera]